MEKELLKIFREIFSLDAENTSLVFDRDNIGNWDSLKHMELVLAIEKNFSIELEIAEIAQINSFDSVLRILKKRKA